MGSAVQTRRATGMGLGKAVHRYAPFSAAGLRERLFTAMFQDLVYPQIWEDPVIDMEALAIRPGDHVVAIASGGCNILSYLTAGPGRITAVDLNHAHVALNRLKLAAARHLPSYKHFADFFAQADLASNVQAFDEFIAPHLDAESRHYWQKRDLFRRRRIGAFARGFYRTGLLGRFIGASHLLGRALGIDAGALISARSLEEQRQIFDRKIAPAFEHWLLRLILKHPASLYGLGIPPAQYAALAGGHGIAATLRARLEKLACGFPLQDNYFAWQAFGRRYGRSGNAPLPPYLQAENFAAVREGAAKVDVQHESMTDFLARSPSRSVQCFVLLDAQDWMNDRQMTELWAQIDRCAAIGARVIFRTAADERLLPGRIPAAILAAWRYDEAVCRDMSNRDRSSIYGAFHLYTRGETA
jgi:S-adenosylmethionine-diacylglycerol 3-amino-3-carboxypropyl transferase